MKLNVFEYVPEDVIISGITLLSEVSNEHLLSVSTRLKGGTTLQFLSTSIWMDIECLHNICSEVVTEYHCIRW